MFTRALSWLKKEFREHAWGLIAAALVGVICVLPQLWFMVSLGSGYHGLHFFATPNEEAYLAIMQEIVDGHPLAASVPFFEYKNALPLLPPTIPFLYVAASLLLHLSLVNTLIISKFFLPAILFFLVYLFLCQLLNAQSDRLGKFTAIAGAGLVTLGFDLVDYRSIWKILTGQFSIGGFLIWTRPVNPISGLILLYIFLLSLWALISKKSRFSILPAALSLALMMASYFFSWSLALTIAGLLGLRALVKRDWWLLKCLISTVFLGLFFSLPYWIMVWRAAKLPWYAEASARIGFFATHAPHLNKFLLAVSVFFALASIVHYFRKSKEEHLPEWWWFCVALLLSCFVVYNQQVITGHEIWYYHYVFFTIPLAYTVAVLTFWHLVKIRALFKWIVVVIVGLASLALGCYTQISAYKTGFNFFAGLQKDATVFDYFRSNGAKDCVVLINESEVLWSELVPAFTQCNTYISTERFVIAPPDRFYHNYLVLLRLRGVPADHIEGYLQEHLSEARSFLNFHLQSTLGFPDREFDETLHRLPADYKAFVKKDFFVELNRYRLDYILSVGPLDSGVAKSLSVIKKVFEQNGVSIYILSK